VLFWLLGGLSGTTWTDLILPMLTLFLGIGYLLLQTRSLNALLIGEETARTLGTDTDRFRKQLFFVTSLLTGVIVAVSGVIGFVGLMIPHSVRFLVGSDHRRVLPVSLLLGGIFLIWADVLARTIVAPEELPIGIITALFGAPFFIWLMQGKGGGK
jgi:iron complex transport system permease protein